MIRAADLFCGAGGTSTGLAQACKALRRSVSLLAVNHWQTAVDTHKRNHPWADHRCMDLASADAHPSKLVAGGALDILAASPECTHHSNARGGKPCSEQSRASAWHVLHWAENLKIKNILIENVKEFQGWGPLNRRGRPDPRRKGQIFEAFLNALDALGFHVDRRVLCAADYGEATTRERLFIQARREKKPTWPRLSHAGRWRPAAEIIDWSIRGKSIFNRPRPLAPNTIARIKAGLKKFGGEAFLVLFNGTSERQIEATAHSLHEPLPTVFGNGAHQALCQPFLIKFHGGPPSSRDRVYSTDEPMKTIDTQPRFALCEPFIVQCNHGTAGSSKNDKRVQSIRKPLRTITAEKSHALCQPFIMGMSQTGSNGDRMRSVERPLPTLTTAHEHVIVEPVLVDIGLKGGESRGNVYEDYDENNQPRPFYIKYYGTGGASPVDEPIDTITAKARFALVEPQKGARLGMDVLLRMLRPHELAAAMGLDDYELLGTIEDQVKQVGNAVSVRQARALFREMLR